jgi:cytochrome o ubiquinol oxidase subunit 1
MRTSIFGSLLLGKLSWNQFPHNLIAIGGAATVVIAVIGIFGLITFTHRWRWLYKNWLTSVDPKKIGVMYIIVALVMLIRGGIDALLLRTQQATSVGTSNGIISANHFQQIFSAHGTMMIFFVAMGLMFGVINLVLPLQIGSRDVAFPFMNSASFWLYIGGVILVNLSLVIGDFSTAGWLAYPPLSELKYSPSVGVDYWIWSLQIAGIGSLLSGVNFFTTIIKMRAPRMSLMKMPMFVWSVLGSMSLVIFAFPILTVTLTLLYLDRTLGMHFFTAGGGGNMMMYVNLIWAWGHPEVYILVLPAFGVFSEIVATFSRKRLFGYTSMVYAIGAIVLLSFTVWLHHFFTMGAGANVNAFFGIATMVIAIPTGVKLFNWLATMYRGRILFATPMLWFMGFAALFTIGGVAGVVLAVPSIDYQLHNSLFLVAHFHMMIVSGVLFGYFAAITYWFPKFFGYKLNERLGKYAFWCWVVGFLTAFVPLYILGFMGATRRLDHYNSTTGFQPFFIAAGVGTVIIAFGVGFQVLQFIVSYVQRNQNLDTTGDPWNARTLEWSVPSPVPFYNFAVLPSGDKRDAFWETKREHGLQKTALPKYEDIVLPKHSPMGMIIAFIATAFGFAAVWHIWWLAIVTFIGVVVFIVLRTFDDDSEYTVPASEIAKIDSEFFTKQVAS